ncbi:MAG: DUF4339 domain-containing protein [Planctomycetota bacterium]
MSDAMWYYAAGADRRGPIPWDQLVAMAAAGQLGREQFVWTDPAAEGQRAGSVEGLFDDAVIPIAYARPAPTQDDIIVRNARQNSIAMFITFLLCAAGMTVGLLRSLAGSTGIGLTAALSATPCVTVCGLFAVVYMPLRWRVIGQLPPAYRRMGRIGGLGLIVLLLIGSLSVFFGNVLVMP